MDGDSETGLTDHWPAFHDGREVGRATTGVWSPRLERTIGYVWVPIELAEPGTEIRLESPAGKSYRVTTADLPFRAPDR